MDIEQIKKLKSMTGVGLTDAKKALEEAGGDFDKALEAMRVKGIAKAEKKADREVSAGIVHSYVHGNKIGVLIELDCETDFVARTDDFKQLANDLALHVAASNPKYLSRNDVPEDVVKNERKLFAQEAEEAGKKGEVVDKIVEGKMERYFSEACLLEQPFVKDPDKKVEDVVKEYIAKLGENIVIGQFSRIELGK